MVRDQCPQALGARHLVIAIDLREDGTSDKPHHPDKYGLRIWRNVIELMDRLAVDRAHLHGYSLGAGVGGQLLVDAPGRFMTAAFGGGGLTEVAKVACRDGT
ncbi:MAG: alpha/beta fold hydrolase [Acidobacteriota bacterium]